MAGDLKTLIAHFAADLHGPEGPVPVERMIRRHLPLFAVMVEQCMTYNQMAAALNRAGARMRSGKPLSAAYLRSVLSRTHRRTMPTPVALPVHQDDAREITADKSPAQDVPPARRAKAASYDPSPAVPSAIDAGRQSPGHVVESPMGDSHMTEDRRASLRAELARIRKARSSLM